MTDPWLYSGAPQLVTTGQVVLIDGSTFCICDQAGNIIEHRLNGFFMRDTRVLSRWHLTVADQVPEPLALHLQAPFSGVFVGLVRHTAGLSRDLLVVRRRRVGNGLRDRVLLVNPSPVVVQSDVVLTAGTDFADLFEVKDGRAGGRGIQFGFELDGGLTITEMRDGRPLNVSILPDPAPTEVDAGRLRWRVSVPPRGRWACDVQVAVDLPGYRSTRGPRRGVTDEFAEPVRLSEWQGHAPAIETSDDALADVLRRSVEDLATLRIFDPERVGAPVVAAGAPWFMALFGRDSLLTAMMLLPLDDALARGTLEALGARQGERVDPISEEEPGRILHELRVGPVAALALGARRAYYGSVDATPLFVALMGELARWYGSEALPPGALEHADRALAWMETRGDADQDGFIEYERKNPRGLVNQGWKDSWDAINFADGRTAQAPIALAEVQGYAYAAYLARAFLADDVGDPDTANRYRERAARLKATFNDTFWLPERGWYAVGLDRDKAPIDSLTSNVGHLLWTGIADTDKAAQVVEHLMSPEMFSGWGIRTLGASMGAFDPLSYHNGSVWPHDTAICAGGLARYGYAEEASRVAMALLDAATAFGDQLPELFSGFSRELADVPVPYPAACAPQAWASVAPVELLRAMLRLEPDGDGLTCTPTVPRRLLPLRLTDVRCRGRSYTVEVDDEGCPSVELFGGG